LQFARIFSNFNVEYGRDEEGTNHTLIRVPVKYGDWSRQAQTVLNNNSASTMPSTPMMTFYITALDYDRPRIQEPNFVSTIAVRQRTYDADTDTYETTQGNAFTIDRLMPVPYKLTMNLDIWTSNTNQKFQLLEQILVLFNPALEIQGTDNYIDWTSLSVCELQSTKWSSRTVPIGTDNSIDISTLTFTLPIWLSSPAKVKKLGVVERIVANVFDAKGDASNAILNNDLLLGTRQVITPYSYQTLLIGNQLQALRQQQVVLPTNNNLGPVVVVPQITGEAQQFLKTNFPDAINGTQVTDQETGNLWVYNYNYWENQGNEEIKESNLLWSSIVGLYGVLRPGISQIRLEQQDGSEVIGTVAFDPTDDRFLLFSVDEDSVPSNTLDPVTAVIDPLRSGPNSGLPPDALGQRYLLTEATGTYNQGNAVIWRGNDGQPLVAQANDIIEYDGAKWIVAFESTSSPDNLQYVTNITTGIQYEWTGVVWIKSYQGLYPGGTWRLVL
jgi:hypothetical protein